jgi:osmoprotectant transport system permease protein
VSWNGRTFSGNWDVVWHYLVIHVQLTVTSLALGIAIALPLAYLAVRHPATYPPLLAVTNIVYAIPSIALFVILGPWLGYTSNRPVIVAMAMYTLVILVRNIVEGVRGVPAHVATAATAMGYGRLRRFVAVELPVALPSLVAGLRLATVSTISLITVGGLVGQGGLGRLFDDGFARRISQELWAGLLAVVLLALVADALILLAVRVLAPWQRAERRAVAS